MLIVCSRYYCDCPFFSMIVFEKEAGYSISGMLAHFLGETLSVRDGQGSFKDCYCQLKFRSGQLMYLRKLPSPHVCALLEAKNRM